MASLKAFPMLRAAALISSQVSTRGLPFTFFLMHSNITDSNAVFPEATAASKALGKSSELTRVTCVWLTMCLENCFGLSRVAAIAGMMSGNDPKYVAKSTSFFRVRYSRRVCGSIAIRPLQN
jgi:hypothetical protein